MSSNPGVYDLCPHPMARVNNGNLLSYDEYQGGAGYPQFLSFHQDFGYDAMDRLTSANDSGGWSRTFQYDPYGNMWVSPVTGPATAAPTSNVYDANNRLLNVPYDAAGNQLVVNGNALGYDAEGRVTTVSESAQWGGGTEMYLYDGEGRRVKKSDSNGKTVYVYDAAGLLAAEYSTRTQPTSTCSTCYLATDHLGTTRLVMDQSGAVVARHDFFPFGEEIAANSAGRDSHFGADSDVITQKFIGKERDSESGLDYFGARYYGSALGRFTSPDPLMGSAQLPNPQTWNRYAYGLNNPLRNTDPLGLYDWDASAGGAYTDQELEARRRNRDLSRRQRNAAKSALDFRARFRAGLEAASQAADASGQSRAQGAVEAYGTENDHNGVMVGVATSDVAGSSARTILNADDTISVNFNPSLKGNELAVTLAHEGQHVGDAQAWVGAGEPVGGPLDLNHYFREQNAWYVSSYIAEALGMRREAPRGGGAEFQFLNSGWNAVDREALRSRRVSTILRYMGLNSTDTNTCSSEHQAH